jgi:ADP-ribosylglycohydrolase
MADEELRSKFRGALLGVAVGDALDARSRACRRLIKFHQRDYSCSEENDDTVSIDG